MTHKEGMLYEDRLPYEDKLPHGDKLPHEERMPYEKKQRMQRVSCFVESLYELIFKYIYHLVLFY